MLEIKNNVQTWLKFHPSTAKHTNVLVFSQRNIIFYFKWTINLLHWYFFCSISQKWGKFRIPQPVLNSPRTCQHPVGMWNYQTGKLHQTQKCHSIKVQRFYDFNFLWYCNIRTLSKATHPHLFGHCWYLQNASKTPRPDHALMFCVVILSEDLLPGCA